MARKLKITENEKHPLEDLKNDEINEKREKLEMHTVGPGIWRDHRKTWKNKHRLQDLEYNQKHSKPWKMRKAHCRIWNMARKLKIMENEKHPLDDMKK